MSFTFYFDGVQQKGFLHLITFRGERVVPKSTKRGQACLPGILDLPCCFAYTGMAGAIGDDCHYNALEQYRSSAFRH